MVQLTYKQIDSILQWTGAVFILVGHALNGVGPTTWPWNTFCFFVGTLCFLAWAIRVKINAQIVVNAASIMLTGAGVINGIISFMR